MAKGVFQIISESYKIGADNLFVFSEDVPLLMKPFCYAYALFGFVILYCCALAFYVLIIFDFLSRIVNSIRRGLLGFIQERSEDVEYSLGAFIFNPVIISLVTPIFVMSALLPKISTELDIDESTGEVLERMDITGSGTFKQIINFAMDTTSNLFSYLRDKNVLVWPFLIVPCLFNAVLMLGIILISTPLLLIDLLSYIIDSIRRLCIKISRSLANSTRDSVGGFLFAPTVLVFLVPIFIAVLIIPKFSSGIDGSD